MARWRLKLLRKFHIMDGDIAWFGAMDGKGWHGFTFSICMFMR